MTGTLTRPRWQWPRLDRQNRWIGGVAAAIATEIGVQPAVIRAAFAILASVGGWGLVLYAITWATLAIARPDAISPYRAASKGRSSTHRHLAIAMITVGLAVGLTPFTSELFRSLVVPVGFVLTGVLIAWSRSETDQEGLSVVVRVVAGLVVAIGGLAAFAALSFDLLDTLIALVFGIAVAAGVAIIAAPSVIRMARDLDGERLARIRDDERARISAHLHDSVLQTLSLIQRSADDPQRTAHLARRQERELRNWLYGSSPNRPGAVRLGPLLEDVASRVEKDHAVKIDVVSVGDDDDLEADALAPLLAAAREAMINAAIHSGVDRIDVFAERTGQRLDVFVRDTGSGFDPSATPSDRRGVTESIVARMARAGGSAAIVSSPGEGTEVELTLPITPPATGGTR